MKSARYLVVVCAAGGGPGAPLGLVCGAPPAPAWGRFLAFAGAWRFFFLRGSASTGWSVCVAMHGRFFCPCQQIMIMSFNKHQLEAKINRTQSPNAMATPRPAKPRVSECACWGRFVFHPCSMQSWGRQGVDLAMSKSVRGVNRSALLNASADEILRRPGPREGFRCC